MGELVGALLAILAIGVVLYPFWRRRFRQPPPAVQGPPGHVGDDRTAIYDEIRTLQLEYQLGAIDEADYQERLRSSRLTAAAALRDHDLLEQELDRGLEEEIRAARSTQKGDGDEDTSP